MIFYEININKFVPMYNFNVQQIEDQKYNNP